MFFHPLLSLFAMSVRVALFVRLLGGFLIYLKGKYVKRQSYSHLSRSILPFKVRGTHTTRQK